MHHNDHEPQRDQYFLFDKNFKQLCIKLRNDLEIFIDMPSTVQTQDIDSFVIVYLDKWNFMHEWEGSMAYKSPSKCGCCNVQGQVFYYIKIYFGFTLIEIYSCFHFHYLMQVGVGGTGTLM